jgi:hypothetical protein
MDNSLERPIVPTVQCAPSYHLYGQDASMDAKQDAKAGPEKIIKEKSCRVTVLK